jgi:hypothetical protein
MDHTPMSDKVDHLSCLWCGVKCGVIGDTGLIRLHPDPTFICPSCRSAYARGIETAARYASGWGGAELATRIRALLQTEARAETETGKGKR